MTADLQSPPATRSDVPFYAETANEIEVFEAAARLGLPIMLKGPTGCGKTRLVEHMAAHLGVPLFTVSCHEDMTAGDLLGRYVLTGGNTEWVDGPLTRAAREGGICYLDEIVEARQDATVAVHSLTDHRREINIERRGGEVVKAARGFTLVCSYNPGYQSVLKDLKMSTRQRMVAIELDYPSLDIERTIILREGGTEHHLDDLLRLGQALRRATEAGLPEVASTRALVSASRLIGEGLSFRDAARAAIALPLTDDRELSTQLATLISSYA
jgi:nitric oxide reductase NorQ protein